MIITKVENEIELSPVIVTPRKLLLHISTGLQAGQGLDHLGLEKCENIKANQMMKLVLVQKLSEGRQQGFGFMRIKR